MWELDRHAPILPREDGFGKKLLFLSNFIEKKIDFPF